MTKKEKINKCREILHKYPFGVKILNPDEIEFLLSIFEGHTEWDSKRGVGVDYITTELTKFNQKCFYLHRVDGSKTDISFTHSITNRSDLHNVKCACRYAIKETIIDFRLRNVVYGETKCPITGEVLTKENTHIDHFNLTFDELFNEWIKNKPFDYLVDRINETTDDNMETYFTDSFLSELFLIHHNNNTNLRAVSKKANLSILKTNNILQQ